MKETRNHLNIDLEFLDKKETTKNIPKTESPKGNEPNWRYYEPKKTNPSPNPNPVKEYNWKNILIIGGVIIFFGWAIFSNNDSSSSTSNNTYTPPAQTLNIDSKDDTVIRGQYRCSSYNASRADALEPSESESTISNEQNTIEQRSTYLENLKKEIDNSYVNEYSEQYEIDSYNQKVDDYNSKLASYKRDAASLDSRIDKFNNQVNARNNYLMNNCTKAN